MILADSQAEYIQLNDGWRIFGAGIGLPPRHSARRQQVIQSIGFGVAFSTIAVILLSIGGY